MNIEAIARLCHEVNRAYCRALGDHSQPAWESAPVWQHDSCLQGVRFHINNPDASPSASHEEWLRVKLADGWQYGPEKNTLQKTHPCIVPFEELPLEQQIKDHLFRAVVHACKPWVVEDQTGDQPEDEKSGGPGDSEPTKLEEVEIERIQAETARIWAEERTERARARAVEAEAQNKERNS